MMAKFLAEVVKENIQSRRQTRAGIEPRVHRGFPYPWVRGATNVALRALGTSLIVEEMMRGTPVVYMDYTDYDEIAHHSGPERSESLDALDLERSAQRYAGQDQGCTASLSFRLPRRTMARALAPPSCSATARPFKTSFTRSWMTTPRTRRPRHRSRIGLLNTFLSEVGQTSTWPAR